MKPEPETHFFAFVGILFAIVGIISFCLGYSSGLDFNVAERIALVVCGINLALTSFVILFLGSVYDQVLKLRKELRK